MSSRIQPPEVPVREPEPKREFTTPDISWAPDSLGPGCSLNNNRRRLFNHEMKNPYVYIPPPSDPYNFPGARATLSLSAGDLAYWEVVWKITISGKYKPGVKGLLRMGVSTEDVLREATEDTPLEKVNRAGLTVLVDLDKTENELDMWTSRGPLELDPEILASELNPTKSNGARMGFLFDGPKSTIHLSSVTDSNIWWTSKVDVSQPLYPFVYVVSRDKVGKEIWLELKTGKNIVMTETKRKLLEDMVKGNAERHNVFL